MTDNAVIYLAIVLAAGGLIAFIANTFTIRIPIVLRQLYLMLVLCVLVYLVISFMRVA